MPVRAVGVSGKLWELGNIVGLVENDEANIDRSRGTYKRRTA